MSSPTLRNVLCESLAMASSLYTVFPFTCPVV